MRTLKQWDARFAQQDVAAKPDPLIQIGVALFEAEACLKEHDIEGMRANINDAHCLMASIVPVAGQAAHLSSVMNAYELTSATAHLGECRA